ncbi:MAG: SDR family NAD(P)-dependent oxidoreductase [Candidatus Puniceispirillum sp.]
MQKSKLIVFIADGLSKTGSLMAAHPTRLGHTVYYGADKASGASGVARAAVPLDINLQDDSSAHAAVTKMLKTEGRIDVLLNNINRPLFGALELTNTVHIERCLNEVLVGAVRLQNNIVPIMQSQRQGRIVNESRHCGDLGVPLTGWQQAVVAAQGAPAVALEAEVQDNGIMVQTVDVCLFHDQSVRPHQDLDYNLHQSTTPDLWRQFGQTIQAAFDGVPETERTAAQIVNAVIAPSMSRTAGKCPPYRTDQGRDAGWSQPGMPRCTRRVFRMCR